jgi:hypothetical protein
MNSKSQTFLKISQFFNIIELFICDSSKSLNNFTFLIFSLVTFMVNLDLDCSKQSNSISTDELISILLWLYLKHDLAIWIFIQNELPTWAYVFFQSSFVMALDFKFKFLITF